MVEAVERELLRERQCRAIAQASGAWAGDGGPTDPEGIREELAKFRAADAEREAYLDALWHE